MSTPLLLQNLRFFSLKLFAVPVIGVPCVRLCIHVLYDPWALNQPSDEKCGSKLTALCVVFVMYMILG